MPHLRPQIFGLEFLLTVVVLGILYVELYIEGNGGKFTVLRDSLIIKAIDCKSINGMVISLVLIIVLEVVVMSGVIVIGQMTLRVGMPIHVGLYVGIISFIVALKVSYTMGSLLGYFVFLLYVGRLLVLFGYILCLFPNQRFSKEYVVGPGVFSLCIVFSVLSVVMGSAHDYFSGGISGYVGNFFVSAPGALGYIFMGSYLFYILVLTTGFCRKDHEPLRIWFSKGRGVK